MLYIALYSKEVYVSPSYEYWIKVKEKYNRGSLLGKYLMEYYYTLKSIFNDIKQNKNPINFFKNYKLSRGMSYRYDVKDWLGGYPMEFAGNKETEVFCRERLNLELIHINTGDGNTEYLFRPIGSHNYWDEITLNNCMETIPGPFMHVEGFAWCAKLPQDILLQADKFMLYENDSPVGWANAPRATIIEWGHGRYNIEENILLFSTTDNLDPNKENKIIKYRKSFL